MHRIAQRIALISEHASPLAMAGGVDSGGQNVYVAQLARHLARAGHHVDVFTRRDADLPPLMHAATRVRVIHVQAGPPRPVPKESLLPYMEEFSTRLQQHIEHSVQPYSLLHANFFMSGHAALPVAESLGLPLIMTFHALGLVRRQHQAEADRFPDTRFDIEAQLVARADRIIAECPQDREDLLQLYGGDPRRIAVVPCGVDEDEICARPRGPSRARLGWPDKEFCLLQLGRLVPRKGIDTAIEALALLRQRGIASRLYIVGGNTREPDETATPEIARLRAIAASLDVADCVHFVGARARHELGLYYGAADVFVTTPWYEPFGITPLEAMACGTPVVASNVGGLRSSVLDGRTGFLVPPRDAAALAERLAALQADPALRARMGGAGKRRVARHYDWPQVAAGVAAVYEQTLGPVAMPAVRVAAEAVL